MRKVWIVTVGLLFGAIAAVAGELVDQGAPGNQGPWKITCTSGCGTTIAVDGGLVVNATGVVTVDGGYLTAYDPVCASPLETTFFPSTTDGGQTCPPTALAGRRQVTICQGLRNAAVGSPILTTTIDGTFPTNSISSPGQELGVGDCITYVAPASEPVHCIIDTADAGVNITECK